MKVVVYAICKNEEKFVDRWYESMKEADEIYVLDTGSTDDTINKLKQKNIVVNSCIISPWRFDVARNKSLELVPNEECICVCTDLDEVFIKGWKKELLKVWNNNTRCRYTYNWSLKDNIPIISFYSDKIHKRHGYKWVNPVHEILKFDGIESIVTADITLNHYPDNTKSRSNYLPLLELAIKEDPENDRNMHYLGREYMYYERWNECIDTLIKHLSLKSATWKDERAASMRFIARSYKNLNRIEEARMWLHKAIIEAPHLRDAYMELSLLEFDLNNYDLVKKYCLQALKIKTAEKTYINETFSWDYTVYDLLSISCFNLKECKNAIKYINKALKMNPDNDRLKKNKNIMKEFIK